MNKTMCPGQDTRFWRPDDIFEIKCGNCNSSVEFFKDEASHLCKKCGNRVQNPKLKLGCAQWCEHAKECLGFDPKTEEYTIGKDDSLSSLADKIIIAITIEAGEDSNDCRNAISALEKAKDLLKGSDADPKIVTSAILMLNLNNEVLKKIISEVELDKLSAYEVENIIKIYHLGEKLDTTEFNIVSDAYADTLSNVN